MKLLLGDMLNIYENKNFVRNSFFGVVQKPKFKHKKGGGGGPNSKFKKLEQWRSRRLFIYMLCKFELSSSSNKKMAEHKLQIQ